MVFGPFISFFAMSYLSRVPKVSQEYRQRCHLLEKVFNTYFLFNPCSSFSSMSSCISSFIFSFLIFLRWFVNQSHQRCLENFFLLTQSILLPSVVEDLIAEFMTNHALLPKAYTHGVVGRIFKLQLSAILHVLLELSGVAFAKLVESRLYLLLLDIVVFFVFGSTRESLPGQNTLQQVKQYVPNTLQIISPRLLDTLVRSN